MVRENGLDYLVDLREGLNTGLFPDQRRNRRELMARATGKRVLNLFAFTGAFSVAAAAAGAKQVTSVDVSQKYLEVARENFSLNRITSYNVCYTKLLRQLTWLLRHCLMLTTHTALVSTAWLARCTVWQTRKFFAGP